MPPRLLTGITLLFWGAMTGHALLGLVAAFLVEARSWIETRWNFTQTTYVRSWHYTILCGALIAVLAWMNGMKTGELHTLFIWTPLIFLPVELAMRYGQAEKIPLNTFSFFARKKYIADLKLGRPTQPRMINTGWIYLATILLATAMGSQQPLQHGIGLAIIAVIALIISGKKTGHRPVAWTFCILLTLLLSLIGQWGMVKLYDYYRGASGETRDQRGISANENRTSIGRLGRLKLSPHIFWRMKVHEGNSPKLLRIATYNRYARANWKYQYAPPEDSANITTQRDDDGYLPSTSAPNSNLLIFSDYPTSSEASLPSISGSANVSIIGEVDTRMMENPIPMPDFIQAVGNIAHLGKETSIECNPLGTVRLVNPDTHIVQYHVWIDNSPSHGSSTDTPYNTNDPNSSYDLNIPNQERAAIRRINQKLGLNNPELTTLQKIRILKHFFTTEFTYTTHLTTATLRPNQRQSAVGTFLETTRSGHCEYFATSTALLLRDAGIPARYCVGFAVSEEDKDREEWVMRGKHAHAWCRVWISDTPTSQTNQASPQNTAGHWEDLDLTPPSWESMEETNTHRRLQYLTDWWQLLREDFMIWRTQKSNQTKVMIGVVFIISLLTLWIIWRLWQSRQPRALEKSASYQRPAHATITALNQLEPALAKTLGSRPAGTPITRWLLTLAEQHPELTDDLQKIADLHNTARFSPDKLTTDQQQDIATACTHLKNNLRQLDK